MKIYNNHTGNLFTDMAIITAALSKIAVEEVVMTDEQQKSKEYKQKCLTGKFPCLETPEGTIFESAAIARYFARANPETGLAGVGPLETAQID